LFTTFQISAKTFGGRVCNKKRRSYKKGKKAADANENGSKLLRGQKQTFESFFLRKKIIFVREGKIKININKE
jgi:hypothetical protein